MKQRTSEFLLRSLTGISLVLVLAVSYYSLPAWVLSAIFALCAVCALCEAWMLRLGYFSLLYPLAPFALLIVLNESIYRVLVPILFVSVFCYDTGAYIFGIFFGKHKLSRISPNKSWEGVFGGLSVSYFATYLFVRCQGKMPDTFSFLMIVALILCAATLGDLFESWLKRRVGAKESGHILPGHGGILDRFDAILGAIPVMFFLRKIFYTVLRY